VEQVVVVSVVHTMVVEVVEQVVLSLETQLSLVHNHLLLPLEQVVVQLVQDLHQMVVVVLETHLL
jgi:hypothetical protein